MLDSGRNPRMGFEPDQPESRLETVNEFKTRMQCSLEEARSALAKAKDNMAWYYNQRHVPAPEYQPGDRVYLDASDIKTTRPSQKLAHRFLGPYTVVQKVARNAYKLDLPPSMKRLHPVFNVVKLLPAPVDPILGRQPDPPPPPELVDGEEHYELESVLDSRLRHNRLEYLVKWKGYGYEHNSWVLDRDMAATDLVNKFHCDNPGAPHRIWQIAFNSLQFRNLRRLTSAAGTPHPKGGVMSGDHRFHFPEPRLSAATTQGPGDPAFPDPRASAQYVRSLPVLWPESGVSGWKQWHCGQS